MKITVKNANSKFRADVYSELLRGGVDLNAPVAFTWSGNDCEFQQPPPALTIDSAAFSSPIEIKSSISSWLANGPPTTNAGL